MTQTSQVMEFLLLERKRYGLLTQAEELTVQMAQAIDRKDTVSVRMLMDMRQETLDGLLQVRDTVEHQRACVSDALRQQLHGLAGGGEEHPDPIQRQFAQQLATNQRLHTRILQLDRGVSRAIAGERSAYTARNA